MSKIFAKTLANKKVMLTDGSELGTVSNVIMDMASGDLSELVVKPASLVDVSKFKMVDDLILVPFEAVRAAKDYTIVDKRIATGGIDTD